MLAQARGGLSSQGSRTSAEVHGASDEPASGYMEGDSNLDVANMDLG